jgi:16S rRNA (uracil1498-N3)-methyltransferase
MHRFFLPPDQCHATRLTLTGREAHHGQHVLRLRQGEPVIVLDGAGHERLCETTAIARDAIRLEVIRTVAVPAPPFRITLVQGLPKGKLMDSIVQKATELGVHRVVPLVSERVVAQCSGGKAEQKSEHWRTVAIEACKQCGSAWLPEIDPPTTPTDFIASGEQFDLVFIASLQSNARQPGEWLRDFISEQGRQPRALCVWVGPEGDFTPAELASVEATGARPITLGRLVLRCETAAIYCLSVLNHEMQMPRPAQ